MSTTNKFWNYRYHTRNGTENERTFELNNLSHYVLNIHEHTCLVKRREVCSDMDNECIVLLDRIEQLFEHDFIPETSSHFNSVSPYVFTNMTSKHVQARYCLLLGFFYLSQPYDMCNFGKGVILLDVSKTLFKQVEKLQDFYALIDKYQKLFPNYLQDYQRILAVINYQS